jgi:CRISPR-associated protein Csc1
VDHLEITMLVYLCRLTLHENLYYATREVGRLYETGRCLHNYALTYALGLATAPYFHAQQVPHYQEDLEPLNARAIYVTPARGVDIQYVLNTFKYASNLYHVEMEKGSRNTPSFGRAKEIAVGSVFEFAVLSEQERLQLPRWVRLGLWRSKAAVTWQEIELSSSKSGVFTAGLPLNPLDVSLQCEVFDLVSMPPVSLLLNARMQGSYYEPRDNLCIPAGMKYGFPEGRPQRSRRSR